MPGRCAVTIPAGTAHVRPLCITRSVDLQIEAPPRLPPGRGLCLCYIRAEARSIRQRSVSSARSIRRLMRPTSLTRKRESAPCRAHGGNRATGLFYRAPHGKARKGPRFCNFITVSLDLHGRNGLKSFLRSLKNSKHKTVAASEKVDFLCLKAFYAGRNRCKVAMLAGSARIQHPQGK